MVKVNFSLGLVIIALIWLMIRIKKRKWCRENETLTRELVLNIFFFYLLFVSYLTMRPFLFSIPFLKGSKTHYHFDFALFYNLRHMINPKLIILYSFGNIFMLVPFGFFLPSLFNFPRRLYRVILMGFSLSLAIELTQTFFTFTRRGTLDDLFFNTLGTALGYVGYLCKNGVVKKIKTYKS